MSSSHYPHHETSRHPQVSMVPVKSTNIQSVGYHPDSSTLWVIFKDGAHYIYNGVKAPIYAAFLRAASKGKFFHSQIKGRYQHSKLK
jgi:hypothetical protein